MGRRLRGRRHREVTSLENERRVLQRVVLEKKRPKKKGERSSTCPGRGREMSRTRRGGGGKPQRGREICIGGKSLECKNKQRVRARGAK